MSDPLHLTAHDLWIEGRKMVVTVQQIAGNASTIHITWTLPPTPYKAYDGVLVLLSEKLFTADNFPEDGKRYTASSNWSAPADTLGDAQVVGAYYGYFGDVITTVSVDVSNTDPSKIYYASVHASSNVLQYFTLGVQSYPLESSKLQNYPTVWAGSIPTNSTPPANPTDGQVYFDKSISKVLVWSVTQQAWIEGGKGTVLTGARPYIRSYEVNFNLSTSTLRFFLSGMWVDCNSTNTRIKFGTSWIPLGAVTQAGSLTAAPSNGDICLLADPSATGLNVPIIQPKVYTMGQWLPLTESLMQFETAPSAWTQVILSDPFVVDSDPPVPEIGDFFFDTTINHLLTWTETGWIRADTDDGVPTTNRIGIGDDGSYDERLRLTAILKGQLGYPSVCVELNEEHFNIAIDNALQTFRQRADNAYSHRFVVMTLKPGQQVYYLNDPREKTDRIVNVLKINRVNQLGLSQLNDPVYGQLLLPQIFNQSSVDLVSIHLMHQLNESYERVFAGNLVYTWDEASRTLTIHRQLSRNERVVLETVMERTEQELLNDRWCQQWLQGWAMAELKLILGMIRSKYSSVPGPNGGLTLNGDLLISEARMDFDDLQRQLNDYEVGNGGTFFQNTSFFIM